MSGETFEIILADDHKLFRDGLKSLLQMDGSCRVTGEASDGARMLEIYRENPADVVLLDIDMPGMDGMEAAARLLEIDPEARIITLSMHGDEDYYFKMVSIGVKGFLLKSSEIDEVQTAISTVVKGGSYFSQELLCSLVGSLRTNSSVGDSPEHLSSRELEILLLICRGLSNQEIAEELFISKRTVDKHRANILAKTGSRNTANLVVYAIKNDLVEI